MTKEEFEDEFFFDLEKIKAIENYFQISKYEAIMVYLKYEQLNYMVSIEDAVDVIKENLFLN